MVVFLGCLFVGIDWGLAFGVGLAVVVQLGHITFPRLQLLGCIPGTTALRQAGMQHLFMIPAHAALFHDFSSCST